MDALHTIIKELRAGKVYGKTYEGRIELGYGRTT